MVNATTAGKKPVKSAARSTKSVAASALVAPKKTAKLASRSGESVAASALTARKKPEKFASRPGKSVAASALSQQPQQRLTGHELIADMGEYRKKVAATAETARDFLTRLGVVSTTGKVKKLIRG